MNNTQTWILVCLGLVLLIGGFYLYTHYKENFTANTSGVDITWQAPIENGGDPACCGYNWAVCAGSACDPDNDPSSVVKSGNTTNLSFTLQVPADISPDTQYTAVVQATNSIGKGAWTPVTFVTPYTTVISSVASGTLSSSDTPPTEPSQVGAAIAGNDEFVAIVSFIIPSNATSVQVTNISSMEISLNRQTTQFGWNNNVPIPTNYLPATSGLFGMLFNISVLSGALTAFEINDVLNYTIEGTITDNNGVAYEFSVADSVTIVGSNPSGVQSLQVVNVFN